MLKKLVNIIFDAQLDKKLWSNILKGDINEIKMKEDIELTEKEVDQIKEYMLDKEKIEELYNYFFKKGEKNEQTKTKPRA